MKREYTDYIKDISKSINSIQSFVSGMSFEDFEKDEKTIFAVIRAMEIIG